MGIKDSMSKTPTFFSNLPLKYKIVLGVFAVALANTVGAQIESSQRASGSTVTSINADASKAQDPYLEAARLLGGGSTQADQIRRISKRYNSNPTAVADKAAKSAELCEAQGKFAGNSVAWSHGSITFVDELTGPIDFNEAFVTYVLLGCPI